MGPDALFIAPAQMVQAIGIVLLCSLLVQLKGCVLIRIRDAMGLFVALTQQYLRRRVTGIRRGAQMGDRFLRVTGDRVTALFRQIRLGGLIIPIQILAGS